MEPLSCIRSFLWSGILQTLPTFKTNIVSFVSDGTTTLFKLDNWVRGHALADMWPHLYQLAINNEGTVLALMDLEGGPPLGDFPSIRHLLDNLSSSLTLTDDKRLYRLSSNGVFTFKSFYNFLNDWGLCCHWTPTISIYGF